MVSLLVCIPFVNLFVHIPHARSSHACADVGIIHFCDMFAEKIECEIFVDKWFIILRSVFQNRVNYIGNFLTSCQYKHCILSYQLFDKDLYNKIVFCFLAYFYISFFFGQQTYGNDVKRCPRSHAVPLSYHILNEIHFLLKTNIVSLF